MKSSGQGQLKVVPRGQRDPEERSRVGVKQADGEMGAVLASAAHILKRREM